MLTRLAIENYALIDSLEIEFDAHLNIITGETGAGKSILMGALNLLLGAKNDSGAIKDNTRSCIVEGEFDIEGLGLEPFFAEHDLDYERHTIIRRTIAPSGKSRAFINDQPVQLAELKEVGSHLIDIHSQHQNLILQSPHFRMHAIDTVAGNGALLEEYRAHFAELGTLHEQLDALREEVERSRRDEEWVRHQVEELNAAALREGEVEELEREQRTLDNADTISEEMQHALELLDRESTGILSSLKEAEMALHRISGHHDVAKDMSERIRSTAIELKDIKHTLDEELEHIDANPERLDALNARLNLVDGLCHKHRVDSVAELITLRDRYAAQLDSIVHGDEQVQALQLRIAECDTLCHRLAKQLHEARAAAAPALANAVVSILHTVGMEDANFEVRFVATSLTMQGGESVEYLFSANAKMEPRAIEKIASGGELSRVMLALKTTLARHLALPTIIFDEIDTGVSGRAANAVGEVISHAAEAMQVINITHLPQVASKGSRHFLVYKEQSTTHLRMLDEHERVAEIAKMLSGEQITDAAILQARNLLNIE